MIGPVSTVLLWVVAINAATALTFAHDKRQSRHGGWRVPEKTLLTLAALGGWPGAKWAQHRLRHKTRKQPFGLYLNLVPVLWCLLAVVLWLGQGGPTANILRGAFAP